jgi:polyphosphate kinase
MCAALHIKIDDAALPPLNSENYINRELSWIEFNKRVLAQAKDPRIPLLERIKFLAIVSSNTDEFFMVRVASVHTKVKNGSASARPDGHSPMQLMQLIRERVGALMAEQRGLMHDLLDELSSEGITIADVGALSHAERDALSRYFAEEIYPILTPLAVDHARPFPFISNLSLNLAVCLRRDKDEDIEFVRIKIPEQAPRLVKMSDVLRKYASEPVKERHAQVVNGPDETFVWIEDLLAANLNMLFPGMEILEEAPFRITRNADIDYEHELEDDDGDGGFTDIMAFVEESVKERRFGSVVRLALPEGTSPRITETLARSLDVDPRRDVYRVNGALGGASLFQVASVDRPHLKYPPYVPRQPISPDLNIFDLIAERDILLHHPYDAFTPVESFFRTAATDPNVLAIKATLYRVGRNSPIVQALLDARDNNKQVAVLVELKARFDEDNNLQWARALEEKGVHVTYGVEELPVKTHAKIAMVVRREGDVVNRYVHLGTGNYNSSTARLYTDLGLLTANREIADDATRLFNRLTGYAPDTRYRRLLVAPEFLLPGLVTLIDNETAAARAGREARIILKMNQLEEDLMIRKMYEASQAGVQIDLLVRGLSCLRPGVPGISDNIRVRSIVGRYLEHSRIYYFHNAAPEQRLYLGSADVMRRNLYNRVEVVFPIIDPRVQHQVMRILNTSMADNMNMWLQRPDDTYERVRPAEGEPEIDSHAEFMRDSLGLDWA